MAVAKGNGRRRVPSCQNTQTSWSLLPLDTQACFIGVNARLLLDKNTGTRAATAEGLLLLMEVEIVVYVQTLHADVHHAFS